MHIYLLLGVLNYVFVRLHHLHVASMLLLTTVDSANDTGTNDNYNDAYLEIIGKLLLLLSMLRLLLVFVCCLFDGALIGRFIIFHAQCARLFHSAAVYPRAIGILNFVCSTGRRHRQ